MFTVYWQRLWVKIFGFYCLNYYLFDCWGWFWHFMYTHTYTKLGVRVWHGTRVSNCLQKPLIKTVDCWTRVRGNLTCQQLTTASCFALPITTPNRHSHMFTLYLPLSLSSMFGSATFRIVSRSCEFPPIFHIKFKCQAIRRTVPSFRSIHV